MSWRSNRKQAYTIIERALKLKLDVEKNGTSTAKSALTKAKKLQNYLLNNVNILRVSVPEDTDLNHYFEIMNTRGEQLEQHEILKARCLKEIIGEEKIAHAFSVIWDACANMGRHVQYGFKDDFKPKVHRERRDFWDNNMG